MIHRTPLQCRSLDQFQTIQSTRTTIRKRVSGTRLTYRSTSSRTEIDQVNHFVNAMQQVITYFSMQEEPELRTGFKRTQRPRQNTQRQQQRQQANMIQVDEQELAQTSSKIKSYMNIQVHILSSNHAYIQQGLLDTGASTTLIRESVMMGICQKLN